MQVDLLGIGNPIAPAGIEELTAAAGDTQVTLTWPPAAGATGYTLYRGTTSTFEAMIPIATALSALSFVDGGLTLK